jgi:catechol 2,3-dioxygenase-like lactoylglutathione lyase family enzyme
MSRMLGPIAYVMLGVKDVTRSLAFYRDQLGMSIQTQFPGFAFLESGSVALALSEPLAKAQRQGPGAAEVVFAVDGVMESYQALRAAGVQFLNEPRNVTDSRWAADFRDPDGHLLSIFGPRTRELKAAAE